MKKIWKYVIITLLMLLGLCCVGILYLFFIPNSNLFNITYINKNKELRTENYAMANVDIIQLNSRAYDVNILSTTDTNVYLEAESHSFGFVLTKNEVFNVTSSLKNNILTINVVEPHGFATSNNSLINLYLPESKSFDLQLTNLKSTTTIDSEKVQINNLNYSTTNGDFDFEQGTINGKLTLNLKKSNFTIHEKAVTNKNDVDLSVTTGKFYAKTSILGDINIKNNSRAKIEVNECETLVENLASVGGSISIGKISQINVKASDTNIYINEVSDGAIIDLTGSGKITINTLKGVSTLSTNSGSINLNNIETTLTLTSNNGNIRVSNAKYKIKVNTNYGDVSINFSEDAPSYLENSNARFLIANIANGTLTASGVEHLGTTNKNEGIKITDKGRLFLKMNNIYGENSIDGTNGLVDVVINKDSNYELTTKSNAGYVRVNLAQISQYNGYTTKTETKTNVNCSSSVNKLSVSTNNGDLKILDTNFA